MSRSLPYIGRHPCGGRRGGIRTSIPISDGQQLLQWLSSEVSLRVPILRSEFFEGGLKVLPKLSFNYILIISSVNNNVKSFLHFFLESHERWCRQYYIHTLSTGCEVVTHILE